MDNNKLNIPKVPRAFFKWYCKSDRFEELHGDLEEFYYERVAEKGSRRAKLMYMWDVLRCFQPYAWRTPQGLNNSNIMMFRNYFKTSFRTMIKNPLSSFINVFGLAVAIAICMAVYAFIDNDYSIDRFHENKDEVYLSTFFVDREGSLEQYGKSPAPLATMLKEDFSQIKNVTRIHDQFAVVKYKDHVFNESIRYTDAEFLEMMTFPLKWGLSESLADVNSIILSENTSIKYFGDENPVGETLLLKFSDHKSKTFVISGVAEKFPTAHIIEFDFLVNFENLKDADPQFDSDNWRKMLNATMIQVENPLDLKHIEQQMDKYKKLQNVVEKDWAINSFGFVKLHDLHFASKDIRDDISYDATLEGRVVLPIIGLLMILLACFNYINIAVVSAARRLKEIGLRKVIGANRKSVIIQFLSENVFITFFAGMLGLLLAITVILPWFVNLSGLEMKLSLLDTDLWITLSVILLLTGIISGIYPAFYISKFEVVKIFKGSVKFGKKNPLTKVFLGFQLVFACIGITGAVMFTQNSAYQADRSWGYEQKGALYAAVSTQTEFDQLESAMAQNPNITMTAGSQNHLGMDMVSTVVHMPDRQYEVKEMAVGADYIETMGLEILEGRAFRDDYQTDMKSILVNEQFKENLDLENPIGQVLKIDSMRYEIVGVVADFHFNNFYYENRPIIFTLADKTAYQFLTMRVREGKELESFQILQKEWATLFPETPFRGNYQDQVWTGFLDELDIQERFTRAVAIILVLLASLGLYGLVKLNVSGREREFSIRKVLGAGAKNIASGILKQYMLLSIIAIIFGAPISHLLITANLDMMFPDPRPFGYTGVAIAVIILIVVLVLVITTQIRKVLRSNPLNGLKIE